jgi:hypothetical protein
LLEFNSFLRQGIHMMEQAYWRKCTTCGKEIGFNSLFQKCTVSTCKKHTYCSVDCWDVHLSIANHKSAWAEEGRSPTKESLVSTQSEEKRAPKRIIVSSKPAPTAEHGDIPKDILIVASKLKNYVKAKHGLNTSAGVMDALSDIVRKACDEACARAVASERKTLMDRDF